MKMLEKGARKAHKRFSCGAHVQQSIAIPAPKQVLFQRFMMQVCVLLADRIWKDGKL